MMFCVYPNYVYENIAAAKEQLKIVKYNHLFEVQYKSLKLLHLEFRFKYVFEICILSDFCSFAFGFQLASSWQHLGSKVNLHPAVATHSLS